MDLEYIHNITENLSYIIFKAYDEEHGEMAQGRFFGTKGEHKAAEILYENMTALGLYTWKEQIENTENNPKLTHKLDILDYELRVNNKTVDCAPSPAWFAPRDNDDQLNCSFSYTNLKVKKVPRFSLAYNPQLAKENEDFVFIDIDKFYNPDYETIKIPCLNTFKNRFKLKHGLIFLGFEAQTKKWQKFYPHCKGLIIYDFNKDTHDIVILKEVNTLPIFFINGTVGKEIIKNIEDTRIDYRLEQQYNTSVISYNVIGQINGTDPTKTVIIDCLYDSWWCQGTADSAIGMAMVLGIAKYFKDHNITPKYNIKFIGFGGEEYGFTAGSRYYEDTHKDENIIYVIDLNQIGFKQEKPHLTLNVISNKREFLREIWKIVERTDYEERVGGASDIAPLFMRNGAPSDDSPFAKNRPSCKTVCFLKDGPWVLHHRDGLNHTEGDTIQYFDWNDVSATGEMVWNVTEYLAVDPP